MTMPAPNPPKPPAKQVQHVRDEELTHEAVLAHLRKTRLEIATPVVEDDTPPDVYDSAELTPENVKAALRKAGEQVQSASKSGILRTRTSKFTK